MVWSWSLESRLATGSQHSCDSRQFEFTLCLYWFMIYVFPEIGRNPDSPTYWTDSLHDLENSFSLSLYGLPSRNIKFVIAIFDISQVIMSGFLDRLFNYLKIGAHLILHSFWKLLFESIVQKCGTLTERLLTHTTCCCTKKMHCLLFFYSWPRLSIEPLNFWVMKNVLVISFCITNYLKV